MSINFQRWQLPTDGWYCPNDWTPLDNSNNGLVCPRCGDLLSESRRIVAKILANRGSDLLEDVYQARITIEVDDNGDVVWLRDGQRVDDSTFGWLNHLVENGGIGFGYHVGKRPAAILTHAGDCARSA